MDDIKTVALDDTDGQPHEAPRFDCAKIGLAAISDKEAVANNFEKLNDFFIVVVFRVYKILRGKYLYRFLLLF